MRHFATLALLLLLAACGQTGPLYLPGEAPPTDAEGEVETETTTISPDEPAP